MSMLNIVCTDQNNGGFLTPQGKFLWFGWVCVLVMGGLGFWLMLKGPREVPSNADHQAPHPAF